MPVRLRANKRRERIEEIVENAHRSDLIELFALGPMLDISDREERVLLDAYPEHRLAARRWLKQQAEEGYHGTPWIEERFPKGRRPKRRRVA
jgi:hypothetical protein